MTTPAAAIDPLPNTLLSRLRDVAIRPKLLVSFGLVCGLLVVANVLGIRAISATRASVHAQYTSSVLPTSMMGELQTAVTERSLLLEQLAVLPPSEPNGPVEQALADNLAEVQQFVQSYAAAGPASPALFETMQRDLKVWLAKVPALMKLAVKADTAPYYAMSVGPQYAPLIDAVHKDLDALVAAEKAAAKSESEAAMRSAATTITETTLVMILAVLAAGVLALLLANSVNRPVRETVTVLDSLAAGRLDVRATVRDRSEFGRMAMALNASISTLRRVVGTITDNSQVLAASSQELTAVSNAVSASAEASAAQAHTVSAAADQISRNISTVSSGGEQMGSAIREIADRAAQATEVASRAAATAAQADETITKLGESSEEIGKVVRAITSIAEQTNLLALNATIEAARAGEAGKGFAVVATEVKELAQAAARATEDIASRVSVTQADVADAVEAIRSISAIVGQINDTQVMISAAVEEQAVTTNEMVRNVAEVATGSAEIAANVTGIASAAGETTSGANQTAESARELSRIAADLNVAVSAFTM